MSVYVDEISDYGETEVVKDYVGHPRARARWCHLIADTEIELHEFALQLGLKRRWAQYPGTWKVHYDIVPSKRALAIKQGAVEVSARELVIIRKRNRGVL